MEEMFRAYKISIREPQRTKQVEKLSAGVMITTEWILQTVLEGTLPCYIEGYYNSRSITFLLRNFYLQTVSGFDVSFPSWIITHSIEQCRFNSTGHSCITHTFRLSCLQESTTEDYDGL